MAVTGARDPHPSLAPGAVRRKARVQPGGGTGRRGARKLGLIRPRMGARRLHVGPAAVGTASLRPAKLPRPRGPSHRQRVGVRVSGPSLAPGT